MLKRSNTGNQKGPREYITYWLEAAQGMRIGLSHWKSYWESPILTTWWGYLESMKRLTPGRKSRRSEIIIITYTLHFICHSHLSSSPHSNFKLLRLVFQVICHQPSHPKLWDHQVSKRDLWDFLYHFPHQIIDYGFQCQELKCPVITYI